MLVLGKPSPILSSFSGFNSGICKEVEFYKAWHWNLSCEKINYISVFHPSPSPVFPIEAHRTREDLVYDITEQHMNFNHWKKHKIASTSPTILQVHLKKYGINSLVQNSSMP